MTEKKEQVRCKECRWRAVCDQCVPCNNQIYHIEYCSLGEKEKNDEDNRQTD